MLSEVGQSKLTAVIAATTKQDLCDFANFLTRPNASCGQFDFIHTGNSAAINAYEVRMRRFVIIVFRDQLETPNAISQFGAPKQPVGSHIVEISKDSCLVDSQALQLFSNFSVSQWRSRPMK